MAPPDFDPGLFVRRFGGHGHNGWLDLAYRAHGEDWVELALPYDPKLAIDGDTGLLASGPIVSLMDVASSLAIWCRRGFRPQATLDLRIDYLRAAAAGRDLVGRATCYRLSRSVAFARGTAHDGDPGDPVAHVACTFMLLDAE